MYARFFRWASDRIDANGIVALVTNRSFVENRTFDGFRTIIPQEFSHIDVIDLGGDVRDDPRLSGTKNNVFGIQTGVAISFLVKRAGARACRIRYFRRPQLETAEEKLSFLASSSISTLQFEEITPNERHDWLNTTANDFANFLAVAARDTKAVSVARQERAIFKLYSLGTSTNRDECLYDHDHENLLLKANWLITEYDKVSANSTVFPETLKWSRNLKRRLAGKRQENFSADKAVETLYRPYCKRWLYESTLFIDESGSAAQLFPKNKRNRAICIMFGDRQDFVAIATGRLPNLNLFSADAIQYLTKLRYLNGTSVENITDWALEQFRSRYKAVKETKRPITKDTLFHYVYGVLHDPVYREKYALNLKREFPRIPFYKEFWSWADWGERLMELHIGYQTVEPWPLRRVDVPDERSRKAGLGPRTILRADKTAGVIVLDSDTQLGGVPKEAWDYRLGNRSALEWVLDQYKEKTPRDPTIRERFNTYRFADHKERVIDLLMRVTRVSIETMAIVADMRAATNAR